jgi:hypothetical protein
MAFPVADKSGNLWLVCPKGLFYLQHIQACSRICRRCATIFEAYLGAGLRFQSVRTFEFSIFDPQRVPVHIFHQLAIHNDARSACKGNKDNLIYGCLSQLGLPLR